MNDPKQTNWQRTKGVWTSGIQDHADPDADRDPVDRAIDDEVAAHEQRERHEVPGTQGLPADFDERQW